MLYENTPYLYAASESPGFVSEGVRPAQNRADKPPRKPDWLLILIGVFVLLTLLIVLFLNNARF